MDGPLYESGESAARHRAEVAAAREARTAAEERAREQRWAAREQAASAEIERRLRAAFVGTPAEFDAEKDELIRQERHRLTMERDRLAREAQSRRYM